MWGKIVPSARRNPPGMSFALHFRENSCSAGFSRFLLLLRDRTQQQLSFSSFNFSMKKPKIRSTTLKLFFSKIVGQKHQNSHWSLGPWK